MNQITSIASHKGFVVERLDVKLVWCQEAWRQSLEYVQWDKRNISGRNYMSTSVHGKYLIKFVTMNFNKPSIYHFINFINSRQFLIFYFQFSSIFDFPFSIFNFHQFSIIFNNTAVIPSRPAYLWSWENYKKKENFSYTTQKKRQTN